MPLPAVGAVLGGSLLTSLKYMIPFLIIELAKLVGFSLLTFSVMDLVLDEGIALIHANLGAIASSTTAVIAKSGMLDALEIIITGWVASVQLKVTMGAFQKIRFNIPTGQ